MSSIIAASTASECIHALESLPGFGFCVLGVVTAFVLRRWWWPIETEDEESDSVIAGVTFATVMSFLALGVVALVISRAVVWQDAVLAGFSVDTFATAIVAGATGAAASGK